jgi:hypothetical protein
VEPNFKFFQLVGEILDKISNKLTFTQLFIFFTLLGMAAAIFIPIMVKTL